MALKRLGPYNFSGVLGRGGMGSVYRGEHKESGEVHAVKVLASNFTHEEHFRNRFESEIQSLIKLDHPNIVRILSYGQEEGNLYFGMELVEGHSLYQMQKKGHRFDWREILDIARAVCKGLRHAHDRGIIHRDLKPGNLLMPVDEEGNCGEVKITDFGIAKQFGGSQITGTNVLGTMDFMSPEQAKGQPVTPRSDLYSLGTVMFTLLSGKPPFSANSVEESLRNLTRVPAPHVSKVVPDVPRELDRLIQKLMSKKPEKRIQTAQALIYKIEETEEKLIESSRAKTHELPNPDNESFEIPGPADVATQVNTQRQSKRNGATKANSKVNDRRTIDSRSGSVEEEEAVSSVQEIDYFNTVTESIRKVKTSPEEPAEQQGQKGLLPILLALLGVIGLAGIGIYNAYKPPTAEALYTEIEANVDQPRRVTDQMAQFLELYPDDTRAPKVKEIQEIEIAIRHYDALTNRLSVRSNITGENRLTEVEKQFLDIIELSKDRMNHAKVKMSAFITIHENADLDERDAECLAAAKGYFIKLNNDAKAEILTNLQKIRSAMESADKTTDPEKAVEVYRSILQLYGSVNWGNSNEGKEGRTLLRSAQLKLVKMQKKLREAQEAAAEKEESESPE